MKYNKTIYKDYIQGWESAVDVKVQGYTIENNLELQFKKQLNVNENPYSSLHCDGDLIIMTQNIRPLTLLRLAREGERRVRSVELIRASLLGSRHILR